MATKTLNFYTCNLQKDTTIMLAFQPPSAGKTFKNQFPVVWKVITFRTGGHSKAIIRYCARLAFGYSQTNDDNMVDSSAWVEVTSGDITSLKGSNGTKRFGGVSKREDSRQIVCKNSTNQRVNLSIGFVKGNDFDQRFDPVFLWTGVGAGSGITTRFTPVVSAYVTNDYTESQFLRGEVDTEAIWTQDINLLDDVTSWYFKEDGESGEFRIEESSLS